MRILFAILFLSILNLNTSAQHLSKKEASADLTSLQDTIETYSSYLTVNGYNYKGHIDSLKNTIADSVSIYEFGLGIRDLIGRLQDAHSKVYLSSEKDFEDDFPGELPFPVTILNDSIVALSSTFGGYLEPNYPYIKELNGVKINKLLQISGARHIGHSKQRFLSRAVDDLKDIEFTLSQAEALNGNKLTVILTNGKRDTTLSFNFSEDQPERFDFSFDNVIAKTNEENKVAYLRINDNYDKEQLGFDLIRTAMESREFAESQGMIIDVRGNTGGTRDILNYLLPYFIEKPMVYNAALAKHDTVGLAGRDLFVPDSPEHTPTEQKIAKEFASSFDPTWNYSEDLFLNKLFVAVNPDPATPYDYTERPVAILADAWSFSATDILLGAFAELPNVTLVGTASAGGSGRSRYFELPNSGVIVKISTMASFRPNGQLYDGYGVKPDIKVEKNIKDVIGLSDSQFFKAYRQILKLLEDSANS